MVETFRETALLCYDNSIDYDIRKQEISQLFSVRGVLKMTPAKLDARENKRE